MFSWSKFFLLWGDPISKREANKKSGKLSPFEKMVENLLSASIFLKDQDYNQRLDAYFLFQPCLENSKGKSQPDIWRTKNSVMYEIYCHRSSWPLHSQKVNSTKMHRNTRNNDTCCHAQHFLSGSSESHFFQGQSLSEIACLERIIKRSIQDASKRRHDWLITQTLKHVSLSLLFARLTLGQGVSKIKSAC